MSQGERGELDAEDITVAGFPFVSRPYRKIGPINPIAVEVCACISLCLNERSISAAAQS